MQFRFDFVRVLSLTPRIWMCEQNYIHCTTVKYALPVIIECWYHPQRFWFSLIQDYVCNNRLVVWLRNSLLTLLRGRLDDKGEYAYCVKEEEFVLSKSTTEQKKGQKVNLKRCIIYGKQFENFDANGAISNEKFEKRQFHWITIVQLFQQSTGAILILLKKSANPVAEKFRINSSSATYQVSLS